MGKKKSIIALAVLFIVLTVASALFFVGGEGNLPPEVIEGFRADGKLRVLIVGEDNNPGNSPATGRSDTLMVASFDPESGELSLLSIPRDTLVEIPGRRYKDKINHALAYGGIELTMRTVSQFLQIPLRYYVQIKTDGFRRIVDAIDGVPIYVEKNMRYTDRAGGLYINLRQGEQTLNGEQAEGYVRYRLDSDIKRTERQQKFVAAAMEQLFRPANILKINQLLRIALESVKTNIPVSVGLRYLSVVDSFKSGNVSSYTIEGDDSVWINDTNYFVADMDKLQELIETYFYADLDKEANRNIRVKVIVANGDMESGEQTAQILRNSGFRIQGIEQAESDDLQVSQVVGTNKEAALAVAQALVLHEVLVEPQADADIQVVVTVGRDLLP